MQRAMLRMMILFLSIMTLTSACAIRGNGQGVAYVADGTIVVAGVALLAQREPEPNDPVDVLLDSESDSTDLFQPGRLKHELGAAMVITGLVAAGLNLYLNADDAKPDPRGAQAAAFAGAELPPLHAGPGANPEAVRLAQQARRLALSGYFKPVRVLAAQARLADPIYYREVMAVDLAIRACL